MNKATPEQQRIFFYRVLGAGSHAFGLAAAYTFYLMTHLHILASIGVYVLVTLAMRWLSSWLIKQEQS